MSRKLRVALVRGPFLNAFECQSYQPLADAFDITAFASRRRLHGIADIPFPVVELPATRPALLGRALALALDAAARVRFGEARYLPGLVERLDGFDVVHTVEVAHAFSGQAIEARRRFGSRVLVTVWENIPFNRKRYSAHAFDVVRRGVIAHADAFISVTERAREALVLEGADPARIRVIPMGVDLERFRPRAADADLARRLGVGERPVVLSVGAMSEAKGLTALLHAVARARLDPELARTRFVLLLVGRDVGHAARAIRALGLGDTVKIVDFVAYRDMPGLYNVAALHVLASVPTPAWQEQFGMALVESLASGTPVVSTLSGSIPEVIGEAGVLVPPADHVALYRGLRTLLLDSGARDALAHAGRRRAEALYDRHVVAKQIGAVYEGLA